MLQMEIKQNTFITYENIIFNEIKHKYFLSSHILKLYCILKSYLSN